MLKMQKFKWSKPTKTKRRYPKNPEIRITIKPTTTINNQPKISNSTRTIKSSKITKEYTITIENKAEI